MFNTLSSKTDAKRTNKGTYVTPENWSLLVSGKNACFFSSFTVGVVYTILNPEDESQKIRAVCTQNMPYALKMITK